MALLCVSDCEEKKFIAISSGKELLIAEENKRQLLTHTHTHTDTSMNIKFVPIMNFYFQC